MDTPEVPPPPPPITPPVQPVPPPPPKNYSGILVGILLLLLSLLVGLSLAKTTILSAIRIPHLGVTPTPTPIPSPTPTPDPTADWKMYTYQIFTIKFPPDWSTTSIKNPVQFLNYVPDLTGGDFNPSTDKGKLKVEIYQNNTSDSLESYLTQQKSSAIEARGEGIDWQETKAMVAGKEAIKVKTSNPGFTYNFKDASSNTIFSVSFALDFDNYNELSDQILSTFRFIEPSTTYTCPPGGWVDCMPGPDAKPECSPAAMSWYQANCPDFKGGAL